MDNIERELIVVDWDGGDGDNGEWVVKARESEDHDWSIVRGSDLTALLRMSDHCLNCNYRQCHEAPLTWPDTVHSCKARDIESGYDPA